MTTDEYLSAQPHRDANWDDVALAFEAGKREGQRDMQERALAKVRTRRLAWIRFGLTQTPRSDAIIALDDELFNVVKDLEGLEVR